MSSQKREKSNSGAALRRRRDELSFLERRVVSQIEISERTHGLVTQKQLSGLETGGQSVATLSVARANALATALGWTLWEMQQATGEQLYAQPPNWTLTPPRKPQQAM